VNALYFATLFRLSKQTQQAHRTTDSNCWKSIRVNSFTCGNSSPRPLKRPYVRGYFSPRAPLPHPVCKDLCPVVHKFSMLKSPLGKWPFASSHEHLSTPSIFYSSRAPVIQFISVYFRQHDPYITQKIDRDKQRDEKKTEKMHALSTDIAIVLTVTCRERALSVRQFVDWEQAELLPFVRFCWELTPADSRPAVDRWRPRRCM